MVSVLNFGHRRGLPCLRTRYEPARGVGHHPFLHGRLDIADAEAFAKSSGFHTCLARMLCGRVWIESIPSGSSPIWRGRAHQKVVTDAI